MKDLLLSYDIMSIDCEARCSQTLLARLLQEEKTKKVLFISSQNYLLVQSELKHLKLLTDLLNRHETKIDFFFLKKPYSKTKEKFFNKFEALIKVFHGEYIYFDRVDYFIDVEDHKQTMIIMQKMVEIVQKYQKKILFVYNSDNLETKTLKKVLEMLSTHIRYSNTQKLFDKDRNMAQGQMERESIVLENEGLVELSLLDNGYSYVKNIQVALISDCEDLKKLNYYLFSEVNDVDYYTIDSLKEEELSEMDNMDIIIFNKEDDILKDMLLHNIKAKKLETKFFMISNKSYLRQKDVLREHINGVDKLLKMDFFLEDYILSIEKYLHSNFYSKRLLEHEDNKEVVITDKERFEAKVDNLLEKKIFFSLFNFKYDAEIDINDYNIRKIVRECDLIFVDRQKEEITFLLLNVVPEFGCELIKKRIANFSIQLKENAKLSAFDIVYEN